MRHEFSAKTKKLALSLAWGQCMAEGPVYGLASGTRCARLLVAGNHDFDHYPLPAHADGSDAVENCMVVCKTCHAWKTAHFDIPAEAKIKRRARKDGPVEYRRKPKAIIKGRSFSKPTGKTAWPKQSIPSRSSK